MIEGRNIVCVASNLPAAPTTSGDWPFLSSVAIAAFGSALILPKQPGQQT